MNRKRKILLKYRKFNRFSLRRSSNLRILESFLPCVIRFILFLILFQFIISVSLMGALFDSKPAGARAIALGGAYIGIVDGAEALAWNPGATGFGNFNSYCAFYSKPFNISAFRHIFGGLTLVDSSPKRTYTFSYGAGYESYGYGRYYSETKGMGNFAIKKPLKFGKIVLDTGIGANLTYYSLNIKW